MRVVPRLGTQIQLPLMRFFRRVKDVVNFVDEVIVVDETTRQFCVLYGGSASVCI